MPRFENGEGKMFGVYSTILSDILLQDEAGRVEGDSSEAERLMLPSDKEWRLHQYFLLVSMQKTTELDLQVLRAMLLCNEVSLRVSIRVEDGVAAFKSTLEDSIEEWAPWSLVVPMKNPNAPPPVAVTTAPGPAWDIRQVLKAAHIIFKPPVTVDFIDEQEMRCVYSLIYDVYRYKSILDQAIEDIEFFSSFPMYKKHRQLVWLFLMELARRRWGARARGEVERATLLLEEAGSPFKDIENVIWEQRVHLAAAVARIRIKNRAFCLSDLLPPHLRDDRIAACVNKETVTGWVNTFKAKKVASLVKRLHELGYSYSNSRLLCGGEYRFDRVCPRFITLRPRSDLSICQLDLVQDGIIVLQEREFCEGASTLCRALRVNELRGVVAQTHASSPRSSAYLAAQLRELAAVLKAQTPAAPATPELGKLVVFGAGDKVTSYVGALRALGIDASEAPQSDSPVCVLSEPVYCDTPAVVSALDGVVAVLATPPNSYSSVTDPIDLVCGRGGDLAMIEILTESDIDNVGKARVQTILEEQKKTLRTLLSKPQIQLVLYETHSCLEAENLTQVTRAVAEANRLARERHYLLKRKTRDHLSTPKIKEIGEIISDTSLDNTIPRSEFDKNDTIEELNEDQSANSMDLAQTAHTTRLPSETILKKHNEVHKGSRPGTTKSKTRPIPEIEITEKISTGPRNPDDDSPNVFVPNCDLFEIGNLPNLGNGLDINYILDRDGCYLGLIQRKEITRLDAKYMIQVAEERGLFGPATAAQGPQRRRRTDLPATAPKRRRRKNTGFEVERVAAPTYASMTRSTRRGSAPPCVALGGAADAPAELHVHVCERHARRQAAATAYSVAACTCDARHRQQIRQRRASADPTAVNCREGGVAAATCRRPFPLAVHDLRLRAIRSPHKVSA